MSINPNDTAISKTGLLPFIRSLPALNIYNYIKRNVIFINILVVEPKANTAITETAMITIEMIKDLYEIDK